MSIEDGTFEAVCMGDGALHEPDKYDLAISYLRQNPEMIHDAWNHPGGHEHEGGVLFGFVGPDWKNKHNPAYIDRVETGTCGCLQQIRAAKEKGNDGKSGTMEMSFWPRLWEKIASDRRIPIKSGDITVQDLPVFAEWQRELDILRGMEA